ncbi:hypothetical protein PV726_24240 [Streptomyces europaeiscabiei]|uniref:preprotein translocase subunit SecD n=1 Tax=Streptomyces europaeiscabiei TaxID=146819 RepID=UPI0029AC3BF2|nr:hypothetical protein [Streptomyces europaeiscabiei]MDX3693401.1 hypothetical protein [Streptomyces europaeiscabiei]
MTAPQRSYAVDVRDGRLGEVMGREGGYVQLRPVGGGREWDCPPDTLREAARGRCCGPGCGRSTGRGGCRVERLVAVGVKVSPLRGVRARLTLGRSRIEGRGTAMRRRAFGLVVCLVGLVCGCGGSGGESGDGKGGEAKATGSGRPRTTAVASPSPSSSGSARAGRSYVTFTSAEPVNPATLERAAGLMRDRAADAGLTGVEVKVEGTKQITVVGPADRQKALESLGAPAELAFRPVLSQSPTENEAACRAVVADASPSQPLTACGESQDALYTYELGPVALPGTDVSDAEADIDPERGTGWFVTLDFTSAGAKKFADVTGRLAQQTPPQNQFAIVLDGTVVSAPSVSTAITGGKAEISGSFTRQEAEELAANLDTGALPVRLTVSSVTTLPAG